MPPTNSSTPPAPLLRRFGKFTILSDTPLGRGGMSEVYRARDEHNNVVALAVLRRELLQKPTVRTRFQLGAEYQPDHPNIVRILDKGGEMPADSAGTLSREGLSVPYYTMQLIEGPSLAGMIRSKRNPNGRPLSVHDAFSVLRTVAQALDAVHLRGLIHRDIKPGNILIRGADHKVFLTDFGVSRRALAAAEQGLKRAIGTPEYMSPEQGNTTDSHEVTSRSDIYSLGVTMYEVLSGQLPFDDEDGQRIIERHRTEPPPDLYRIAPDVPRPISDVVMRALHKDPNQRFISAGAFAEAYKAELDKIERPTKDRVIDKPIRVVAAHSEKSPKKSSLVPLLSLLFIGALLAMGGAMLLRPSLFAQPSVVAAVPTELPSPVAAGVDGVTPETTSPPQQATALVGDIPTLTATVAGPALQASPTLAPVATATPQPTLGPSRTPGTPSSTRPPQSTPLPPVNNAFRVKLEALGRGGYEQWHAPNTPGGCDDGQDTPAVERFKLRIRITNNGRSPFDGYFVVMRESSGVPLVACSERLRAPAGYPALAAGKSHDAELVAYPASRSIVKIELFTRAPRQLVATLCVRGEQAGPC